ncbi:MAG: hypothetical protein KUG81_09100, partial [Gammaproteobacteria bacterium]|nr:hypothetical protein [Gammaproteobacteria bacterium]
MDDEQLLWLQNNGFSVNEIGAIIDKEGAYTESVEIDGTSVQSPAGLDEYNNFITNKAVLEEINFSESDGISANAAKGKNQLENIEAGGKGRLPSVAEGTIYEEGYEAYRDKKLANNEPVHSDFDGFRDEYEDTIYKDLTDAGADDDQINELKDLREEKDYLEKFHPSWEGKIDAANDESNGYILGFNGMPVATPGEDANWLEKANFWLQDAAGDTAGFILKIPITKSAGMEDNDAQKRYEQILDREKQIIKPIAEKRLVELDELNTSIEELAASDETSYWGADYDKMAYAETLVGNQRRRLESYTNDDKWWEIHNHLLQAGKTVLNADNLIDFGTLGLWEAHASLSYRAGLRKKIDNGEELSAADTLLGQVFAKEDEIAENGFENNFVTDVIDSTNESLKFLAFGQGGRTAGKAVGKMVTKSGQGLGRRVAREAISNTIQVAGHSGTYANAGDYYAGKFEANLNDETGEVELSAGWRLYDAQKETNRQTIEAIENAIDRETNSEKKLGLQQQLHQMNKFNDALKEPATGFEAGFYGATENFKEILAENFGGAIFRGMTKPIAKPMTVLGKKLEKIPGLNQFNKMNSAGKNFFNERMGAVPGQKLIGSNTEEIFEEMLVQATPTYGQNFEEYKEQAGELFSFDFYSKVAASTMLMQKTMALQGVPGRLKSALNKDERAKMKALNELYKEIGSKHITQVEFNTAMMKVGEGNFSGQEYNNSINALRDKGLVEEANEVERTKFIKQAMLAEKAGNLKGYKKALTKAKFNKNLDPMTVANIELLMPEIDNMLDVTYINRTEVIDLKSKERFAKRTAEQVETE